MEKAKGTALGKHWSKLSRRAKSDIIRQVLEVESRLASLEFSAHRCIYYAKDLPKEYQCIVSHSIPGDASNGFCIGPLVKPTLWEDGRPEMELFRGPCEPLFQYEIRISTNSTDDRA